MYPHSAIFVARRPCDALMDKVYFTGQRISLTRPVPTSSAGCARGSPTAFLPHDRLGIDPFRQRFPITLRAEGTVRGSGGIRILDRDCSTQVPGLYAAGDAASREGYRGRFEWRR
jgi:succinate dehydrogenase/fumarate reductase flavoprotein subunit